MREELACAILRLGAVVSVLVGVILTTETVLAWIMMSLTTARERRMQIEAMGSVGLMGGMAIAVSAVPIVIGLLFFRISPRVAAAVCRPTSSSSRRAAKPARG